MSLTQSASVDDARQGLDILTALGATGTSQAVLRDRHRAGLEMPRRPRRQTLDNPAGLTTRELEVLALLANGLTNTQLAARLFLSEKTVGHHVSAILRKLDEPNRGAAAAAARRRGLLSKIGNSRDVPT